MTPPMVHPRVGLRLDVVALALALVALLAALLARLTGLDTRLFLAVNGWRGLPDGVWETLSVAGLGLTALVTCTIDARRHPRVVATLPWMFAVGGGLTHVVKHAMPLPRPASVLAAADLHVVGPKLFLRSMPSGHAMTASAMVCILFLAGGPFWRRPWVLAGGAALVAAIGVSRLVSGAHWPADVAAGTVLGVAAGCVSVHLAELTRTAVWLATAPGQWLIGATQLGAGVAITMDQGYGRTLALQWVLATLVVWAGLRTVLEQPWPGLRRREEART